METSVNRYVGLSCGHYIQGEMELVKIFASLYTM